MSDDKAPGTAGSPKLVKAGCGFRYDPDELSPETGFNFEAARELLNQQQAQDTEKDGNQQRAPQPASD